VPCGAIKKEKKRNGKRTWWDTTSQIVDKTEVRKREEVLVNKTNAAGGTQVFTFWMTTIHGIQPVQGGKREKIYIPKGHLFLQENA